MKKTETPLMKTYLRLDDDPRAAAHGAEGFDRLTVLANAALKTLHDHHPELRGFELVVLVTDRDGARQGIGGSFPNAESDYDAKARLIHNLSNGLGRIAQASPELSAVLQAAVLKWAGH